MITYKVILFRSILYVYLISFFNQHLPATMCTNSMENFNQFILDLTQSDLPLMSTPINLMDLFPQEEAQQAAMVIESLTQQGSQPNALTTSSNHFPPQDPKPINQVSLHGTGKASVWNNHLNLNIALIVLLLKALIVRE